MLSELTLIITENSNEITRVNYALNSVCPSHGSATIDISELLSGYEENKGNMQYLSCAAAIFELICRGGRLHNISAENAALLERLFKLYKAAAYEAERRQRQTELLETRCRDMLSAAERIANIIRKQTFETLTARDFHAMKNYLRKSIPPVSELMGYPPEVMNTLFPVFNLLKLLYEFSPTDADKKYIDNIFRTFYS